MDGLDEMLQTEDKEKKVVAMNQKEEPPKRKQFHFWSVAGVDHKLKLTTSMITKLEGKYKTNVINLVMNEGVPPLSVMLTIVQAALIPWEHGTSYKDVEKLFDVWLEQDGGDQQSFFKEVIVPLMAVSGFFTEKQTAEILESLEERASQI